MLYVNYILILLKGLKENVGCISQENRHHITYFNTGKLVQGIGYMVVTELKD